MDTQIYENMLTRPHRGNHDVEASWDARAKGFYEAQKKSKTGSSGKVVQQLLGKGLLENKEILDIGGGTGRYAVPFAGRAKEVTMIDISAEMLAFAKNNAEAAGHSNLNYLKMSWEDADLVSLGWEKRFDLVFASMCAAVRSKEGIEKMSAASKGWCQINQFIEMADNVSKELMNELAINPSYDPHNDRDAVQGIFNLLWLQGFEPEISHLKDTEQRVLSVDEAAVQYSRRFGKAAVEKKVDLKQLLAKYAGDEGIEVERRTTLSLILWEV